MNLHFFNILSKKKIQFIRALYKNVLFIPGITTEKMFMEHCYKNSIIQENVDYLHVNQLLR